MYLGEYLGAVVVMSAILGVISYVSYPSASEKTVKFAATVLLLYTALTPIMSFALKVTDGSLDGYFDGLDVEKPQENGEYLEVAEEAFKEGIYKLLFTRYGIKEEEAEIFIFGFDFRNMRAERIKILLYEGGALADFRGIESYITESGLGECEVNIKVG